MNDFALSRDSILDNAVQAREAMRRSYAMRVNTPEAARAAEWPQEVEKARKACDRMDGIVEKLSALAASRDGAITAADVAAMTPAE